MKPNFALSLSFEGIRLLHRATDGWRVVGDVSLDAADLAGELSLLRSKASDLETGGVRTKLIIPNDQIKYLTLETGDRDLVARTRQAVDALDGATPYSVSELAYTLSVDGSKTYVAAVARETLSEAEAFANEHRFHPVSWVAIPEQDAFVGEPFFGQTISASTLIDQKSKVEPDKEKIVILGNVDFDTGPIVGPDEDVDEPTLETATPPVPEKTATVEDHFVPSDSESNAAPPPQTSSAEAPTFPTETPPTPSPAAPSVVGFASRRVPSGKAPALSGATRDISTAAVTAANVPEIEDEPPTPPLVLSNPPEPRIASGFLSRRKQPKSDAIPAPAAVTTAPSSEAQRLTIFGARKPDGTAVVGGKPKFLGLILTSVLLLFLAGVAAWASVFMDEGLARFFGGADKPKIATAPVELIPTPEPEDAPQVITASLSTDLSSEDAAVLDALRSPQRDPVVLQPELNTDELTARYAISGIWPKAPEVPQPALLIPLEDLYITSIDPISTANDAVALPNSRSFLTDNTLGVQSAPAAAGTRFSLDSNGLVIPTLQGAVSPDGVTVYLGRPPSVPPTTPTRAATPVPIDPEVAILAKLRPQPRPSNLIEQNERSTNGGLTQSELAEQRPRARPALERAIVATTDAVDEQDAQANAATAAAAASLAALPPRTDGIAASIDGPENPQAVHTSPRPDSRPNNFARIVQRAIKSRPKKEENAGTRVASIAPRTVTPKIPSSANVAKSATVKNAINLGRVNLIGVYGKPSNRRALIRLSNGRYQKVKVGDRIDGGRVSAIGDSELRYQKGSRNLTLKMPKS